MSQPTTSPISGLHHFAVSVKGLAASIAWYQKVFQATLAQGTLPHYGREWSGGAELLIESCTGVPVGLHNNNADKAEEFDEARAGLDHISFQVQGREGLEAWGDWLDSLAAAHSGIQSKKEPFVYLTIVFRDLDKMQLEFVAIDV
jgi:glyoxylase I family protein